MGVVLNRVSSDTSMPPRLYGATGLEVPVSGASRWNDRVDVAIVGGGITGLWTAYHLATKGARVAVLEQRQIGHGASGRAFGQLVPCRPGDRRDRVGQALAGSHGRSAPVGPDAQGAEE